MGAETPVFSSAEKKSTSMVFQFAGSKFTYRREDDKESISTLGPVKDRIIVKVKI